MEKELTTLTEKDQLLQSFEREFQTTVKVLKAFPISKLELKPAEKSRTARELAWVFVGEQAIVDMTFNGKIDLTTQGPPAPKTMNEILTHYENIFKKNLTRIKNASDEELNSLVGWPVSQNATTM